MARIDWTAPATLIERQVRAFAPAPGAWFEVGTERIKLLAAELAELAEGAGPPGVVLDDQLTIATGEGTLRPTLVQRAGRAAMSPAELLRGFPLPPGTRLA